MDNDPGVVAIAQMHLKDQRISFHIADGNEFLRGLPRGTYDLIFADAMPGKYEGFSNTIELLKPGGVCVLDDMRPQPNWPPG